jgi:hypothetical protein
MKRSLAEQLAAGKEPGADAILVPAQKQLDTMVDRLQAELKKPAWERSHVRLPDDGSVGARLVALVLPALERAGDSYTSEEARIRLLACHAAILRYRWEHETLPPNLAVLNLGELAVDPFTGQPLRYELRGTREYRLSSAGPTASTDDPKAVNGRRPISAVPGEP